MADKQVLRLDKMLAHMGIGSRREIKQYVRERRILVNGQCPASADIRVRAGVDTVTCNGKIVNYREYIYLMMNKPAGVLSATEDGRGQEVVTDLLPAEFKSFAPFPVGRLDKDTEGLLLLTNDGKLAHGLLSPKKHVDKMYYALIEGEVPPSAAEAFFAGITLDDGYTAMSAKLVILHSGARSEVQLTVQEGKFHQVKRMFKAIGKSVVYLKRLSMGTLVLDHSLSPGECRELMADELKALLTFRE